MTLGTPCYVEIFGTMQQSNSCNSDLKVIQFWQIRILLVRVVILPEVNASCSCLAKCWGSNFISDRQVLRLSRAFIPLYGRSSSAVCAEYLSYMVCCRQKMKH